MNATRARYALLVAADALQEDPARLEALVADDHEGDDMGMTAQQVVDELRVFASLLGRPPAPEPSEAEQREIERFGIFAEEQGRCLDCPHVLSVHGPEGCVAASGCDCKRVAE